MQTDNRNMMLWPKSLGTLCEMSVTMKVDVTKLVAIASAKSYEQ